MKYVRGYYNGCFKFNFRPIEWLYAVPFALFLILLDELRRYSLRKKWVDSTLQQVILH